MSLHPMPRSSTPLTPTIIIDTREQAALPFTRYPAIRGTLQTGDYSIRGLEHLFSIERKSIDDLAGSITKERDRFERELHRLRGYRFARLLIVGSVLEIEQGGYRSNVKPQAILASLAAFECRYDLPVVFEPSLESAARRVESWAYWFTRELTQTVNALQKDRKEEAK